jgi:hypothetical protein
VAIHNHDYEPDMHSEPDEEGLLASFTRHIARMKPRHFAICGSCRPCVCGHVEGEVLAWGFVLRRGVTTLDDDGTPVGLYNSIEEAHAFVAREHRNPTTYLAWLNTELAGPPAAFLPNARPYC